MKSKLLPLFSLALILSLMIISAADFTVSLSNDLTKSVNKTTLTITNTNSSSINVIVPAITSLDDGDGHTITLNQDKSGTISIPGNSQETVKISHSLTDSQKEDLALDRFSETITITDASDANKTVSTTLNFISDFCETGELREDISEGERYLEIISVKDKSSDNDWEWNPLDTVDIDVKVRFRSDDNDDDIDGTIEIGLYDTTDNEFIDFEDGDTIIDFSLDEGDSTTETFTVTVPVEDLQDSTSRYKLYVKVYQEDDEDIVCADKIGSDYSQNIEIKKNSYDVILKDLDVTSPAPCGGEVEVTGKIYNIGTHDEDKTIAILYNNELKLNTESEVFSLDEGDSQRFTYTFLIPEDATEKTYTLELYTKYRYSDSSEEYRETSDAHYIDLKVAGNCNIETKDAMITAELDSETPNAVAGKQVIINANIKNTGDSETTYTISVLGNSAWSSLSAIDPQTITLAPGESKEINIYLDIDDDAKGEEEFTIRASFDGDSREQKVSLTIEQGATQNIVFNSIRENWFIYVIAVINIILIIAIILVVRSMVSRTPAR